MSEVAVPGKREVGVFNPKLTRPKLAKLDGDIVTWRKLKDWPKLIEAVDEQIAEQKVFVAWWDGAVRRDGGLGGYTAVAPAGQRLWPADEAEAQTGISKQTVSRWRTTFADPDLEHAYRKRLIGGPTRIAFEQDIPEPVDDEISVPLGKFGTIVVDPPWKMTKVERDVRPNQTGFDYPTMSLDQLLDWSGVTDKTADDCHLFCWATHKWLPAAIRLVGAWGFRYCLTMVWHKAGGFQPVGLPQFNCEFVVYARRGSPKFIDTKAFPCCFDGERREHSRKPVEFYDLIRRVTAEPRIDIFSRERHEGFAQYGNETEKFVA